LKYNYLQSANSKDQKTDWYSLPTNYHEKEGNTIQKY